MPDIYKAIPLHDALDSIAAAFGLNADALIEFAALDPHGGYNDKYDDGFPTGSIWRVEGQVLYALVSTLALDNPLRCLELGTHRGCSATHIAQALHDATPDLHEAEQHELTCVSFEGCLNCLTPAHLMPYIEFVRGNMFPYLEQQQADGKAKFDFIFEDGSHNTEDVETVWRAAWTLLKPGGFIVTHDAAHFHKPSNSGVGPAVREGIARAGYMSLTPPPKVVLMEPSDCGLAVYRKPVEESTEDVPTLGELVEKPKRKPKERA